MKVYAINTSWLLMSRWIVFSDGTEADPFSGPVLGDSNHIPYLMSVCSFLIDHPDAGYILFDTGFDIPFLEASKDMPQPMPVVYGDGHDIVKQLARIGVAPEDIKTIVVSHLDPDHVGAIYRFPKATCYLPGEEYDDPEHFPFTEGDVKIEKVYGDTELFEGVKIVKLPGHTSGHQGLMLDLENAGKTLLIADAAYTNEIQEYTEKTGIPPRNARVPEKYIETLAKLREYEKEGIKLMPSHDMRVFEDMPIFPGYID